MQTQPSTNHNPNPPYMAQTSSAANLQLQKRLSSNQAHVHQFTQVEKPPNDNKEMIHASIYSVLNFDNMQQQEFKYEQMMQENWLKDNSGNADLKLLQNVPQDESARLPQRPTNRQNGSSNSNQVLQPQRQNEMQGHHQYLQAAQKSHLNTQAQP